MTTQTFSRQVRFSDTDAAGVMHFSRFLCWMEDAEHEFMRSLGLAVLKVDGVGEFRGWARRKVTCEYLVPLRFPERADIEIVVTRVGKASVELETRMLRCQDGRPCAQGTMTIVYMRGRLGGTFERLEIPAELRARLR